jgi:hypothetical protein
LTQRQQRRIAATSAALPGSTKAPLHLFATHIVDRHHVMTHGTFFLQWWHFWQRKTSLDHKTASLLTAKMAPNQPLLLSTAIPQG